MKCMLYHDPFIVLFALFDNMKKFRKSDDVSLLYLAELCMPAKSKHISHILENHNKSLKQSLDLQDELKKVFTWSSTSVFGYKAKFQELFITERKKKIKTQTCIMPGDKNQYFSR